jgi:hypothetical protein
MSHTIDAAAFASVCAPVPPATFVRLLLRIGFSPAAYQRAYDDLAARDYWDATQLVMHFLEYGLVERRVAPMTLDLTALVAFARLRLNDRGLKARLLASLGAHLFDAVSHPYGGAIAERWPAIRSLARQGACPYFVVGDSHSHQFNQAGSRAGSFLLPIHLLCTGGSASGLGNPASRSGYGATLRQAVAVIDTLPGANAVPILLQFGQVDIEFVHHYQRVRDAERTLDLDRYRAFCGQTLDRYIAYVTTLFGSPARPHVSLVSVFPPVLSDASWRQGYVNGDIVGRETDACLDELSAKLRQMEIADLRQRTEIHAWFNDRLREACRLHGFGFVDAFTPFLGPDGLADPHYVSPESGGAQHHLDYRRTHDVAQLLIWQCIDAIGRTCVGRQGGLQ